MEFSPPENHGHERAHPLILLVDDSDDNREMYALFLRKKGFAIAEAGTGQQAIDQAALLAPDVIIMDLSLPDMDGEQAIHQIRIDPRAKNSAILVVSGYSLVEYGGQNDWDSFLIKPCLPDVLEGEIRRVMKARLRVA